MTIAESRRIASKVLAIARTREPAMSRLEFSKRCKHVAGEFKGFPYDPDSDPIQRFILTNLDRTNPDGTRVWERFYWCAPPQFGGKTIVGIIIPLLHAVTQDRVPTGYALPTLEALEKAWHAKLRPQISESGFMEYMPQSGPGSKGGRGHIQQFRHPRTGEYLGQVIFCTPGAYGDTVATMLVDEVDQFRLNGEPDLDGLEDLWNRGNSYRGRALRVAVGTVEWDEKSTILTLVEEQGTCTRPWLRCPHCSRHQLIDPEKQLHYEGDDDKAVKESARLTCSLCGSRWTEMDRQHAVAQLLMVHKGQTVDEKGVIQGPVPNTVALSVLEDAFSCPHSRLPELAREDWLSLKAEKKGDFTLRRKFFHHRLCRAYQQPAAQGELTHRVLADRSKLATYHKRQVPPWVKRITVACDVQKDRHYWLAVGHGDDRRWCIIDWGFVFLTPRDEEGKLVEGYEPTPDDRIRVMDEIAAIIRAGWMRQGSEHERVTPSFAGIDTGYKSEEIIPWITTQPDFVALKGVGRDQEGGKDRGRAEGTSVLAPELGNRLRGILNVTQPTTISIQLWLVHGSNVRQQVHSGLLRGYGSAASGEVPKDLKSNDALLLHLTAEAYTKDERTGKWYWREVRANNHWLDCCVYAVAMGWAESEIHALYPPAPPPPKPPPANDLRNPDVHGHDHHQQNPVPLTTPDGRPYGIRDR